MTIRIFRAHESEPWSSIFTGMLSSLQPVKRAPKADDLTTTSDAASASTGPAVARPVISKQKPSLRKSGSAATHKAAKRRRLNSEEPSDVTTPFARPRQGLISSYFTPSDSYQSDDQVQVPASLYDDYQRTVHEAETKSEDKRTLRSQDDSNKPRSMLAFYFADYDDVMNDKAKEPEMITKDTVLILKGEVKKKERNESHASVMSPAKTNAQKAELGAAIELPESPSARYNGAQILDFFIIEKSIDPLEKDPLSDDVYYKTHRRAERKEKQLRNIERERAMHDEAQLDKLLEGLQSHDWLRVMGVTGIHDADGAKYQSKRDHFIAEVKALVAKFQHWREEEKRQKSEKNGGTGKSKAALNERLSRERSNASEAPSQQPPQDTRPKVTIKLKRPVSIPAPPVVYRAPTPDGPFLSFYDKPHMRDAALGKNRHGRTALAFGQPLPELDEQEFELPPDYIDPQSLKESARRRRRMKRELATDSSSKI